MLDSIPSPSDRHRAYALRLEGAPGGAARGALSGELRLPDLAGFEAEFHNRVSQRRPADLTLDLAGLEAADSAGALVLRSLGDWARQQGMALRLINIPPAVEDIFGLINPEELAKPPLISDTPGTGLVEQVGGAALGFGKDLVQVTTFLGELLLALWYTVFHPRSVRWPDVVAYLRKTGLEGLPIVSLISFLLGLILAFMSSLQLRQFGANIYVASLLAIAMVKELGPIMTAILVAGRSGSAFAAEIGTMKVNEEVDALVTMGFDPTRFLALPKVLATMVVVPLLTLYADLMAIIGGLLVGVLGLDLTVYGYLTATRQSLTLFDLISSLVKAGCFAVLIAGIGCQRGFQVRGGAAAVGTATTSAVVAAIFLIIVVDSAFALVFHYLNL